MRLDKFLAISSIGTRKAVRDFVKQGKICVNNEKMLEPSIEIDESKDAITYLGEDVFLTPKVYYMFHKPAGCITARTDNNRKTVMDYFGMVNSKGLFPVGRLDKDTEGLLFLTNDGEFNHQLMYPENHVEKTYFFWAFGSLDKLDLERLQKGISISETEPLTKPAIIQVIKEGLYDDLKGEMDIGDLINKKKNLYHQKVVCGYLTISEGRKHQVKRMLKSVGCFVVYLKRISIGHVQLDKALEKGSFRRLSSEEVDKLVNQ
ncbi:MAG TPA: pseudouridine synthase [Lachnospiraceae bacterium]|nr:pseudouridine synthase [Lachnospiraceae bacterium]